MQTPVEIDFQGMRGRPEVQASIEHHVAELEQRYGRVTACRVVLKGPGGHHRTGGLYEGQHSSGAAEWSRSQCLAHCAGGRTPRRSVICHQ